MTGGSPEGYTRALGLLEACASEDGFLASPIAQANYRRIWARDGAIISLAALASGRADLIDASARTFETLARWQGPHGEIPSNVDTVSGRVSYGGTTGRVDADLWFVIGCAQHWRATGDAAFLARMFPVIERVRFLLGAWEYNGRGLIYVPQAGDWADEYIQNGYVLYDQLLYLRAQRELLRMHRHVHGDVDHALAERTARLERLIRANYWFYDGEDPPDDVYHEVLYRSGRHAAKHCADSHWMPFFSPFGYGYRFDAFANVLASLLGVADRHQRARVDTFIAERLHTARGLLPAFFPVITPRDEDWKELQVTFSHTFKNRPYEYHNGGLWPMITGFYVADLAARGQDARARHYLDGIHRANALEMDGDAWAFPEYVNGQTFEPGGTRQQGWSAAGAVIAQRAVEGRAPLLEDGDGG